MLDNDNMNPRTAQQLLYELELGYRPKTNAEKLRTRKVQLCGKSRDTNVIIDADALARLVKVALLQQQIKDIQKEIETLKGH